MSTPQLAPDYRAARARFLAAAEASGADVVSHRFIDPGPDGRPLYLDVASTGPRDASSAVFVVSGTHGIEGYAGSMCQSQWLERHGHPAGETAIVWLHAHNPFGFAWGRRVNEQNIDLNRNYHDGEDLPANPGYDELAEALDPPDLSPDTLARADADLLDFAGRHGMDGVQAAISAGQYTHPTGLFYGGTAPTHSQQVMREVLVTHLAPAARVAILDLHTGLGEFGALELITHEHPDSDGFARAKAWWGDQVVSMTSEESVSADLAGTWLEPAERWLAPREVTGIALEWGTVDPITVLMALRADNWLHHFGDPTGPEAAAIKAQIRAAFAPDEPAWAATVYESFETVLGQTLLALGT